MVCVAAALLEHQAAISLGHRTAAATALGWLAGRAPTAAELTVERARTEAAAGRTDIARETVRPLLRSGRRPVLPWTVVDAWVVETNGACSVGDRAGARRAVRSAMALAEPWDAVRPFAALDDRAAGFLMDVVGGLPAGFPVRALTAQARCTPAVPVGFSARELAVLARLPSLLRLDDIAVELGVSVNTVKTHLRSICTKLGVTGRRAAVLAAQERGG